MLYGFLERDDVENFWAVLKSFLFSANGADECSRWESALQQAMFLPEAATSLMAKLNECGHQSIGIDLSEMLKAGGGIKCCVLEVRAAGRGRSSA